MSTTIASTVQDYLSLPQLASEVKLAAFYDCKIRQLATPVKVTRTYRRQTTDIPVFGRAVTGTETSVPAATNISPGSTTVDPVIYEAAVSDTKLAEIISAYDLPSILIKRLGQMMAAKYTREMLQSMRGYGMATYNVDSLASATKSTAVVYTPKTAVNYANFGTSGATGTTAAALSSEHLDFITTWARARYNMPSWNISSNGATTQSNKLVLLTSPFVERLLLSGSSATLPAIYLRYTQQKYFDFAAGEIPGMIVAPIWDCEINISSSYSAVSGTEGGIKCNTYTGYYESFVMGQGCVEELTWEDEVVTPHVYTDEGAKRTKWTATAFKNFAQPIDRPTGKGEVGVIHIPNT